MKRNRIVQAGVVILLAAMLAGSCMQVAMPAMGVPCTWVQAWLPALLAAALIFLSGLSVWGGIASLIVGIGAFGALILTHRPALQQILPWIRSWSGGQNAVDAVTLELVSGLFCPAVSAFLGACMLLFLRHSSGTPFAILVFFSLLMVSYALEPTRSFTPAIPGLIAAVAAFSLSSRATMESGALSALIAALITVALALPLVPENGATWAPLERVAATARSIFEDYFRFTEERVPFTITTEGYNHAVQEQEGVVARLGGPAEPDEGVVLRVKADKDVLLRGTIRRTYTGNNWIDIDAKARYLYYDMLRRSIRTEVLGMSDNEAFEPVTVEVQYVNSATSSLFVPARLNDFSMNLQNAVYFNSIGEMFLSRPLSSGDTYRLTGAVVGNRGDAVRSRVAATMGSMDDAYADALDTCLRVPDVVEGGVYQLAIELAESESNPYDKALAIERWLRNNCTYTLTPDMPDPSRDFVSQFVLSTRRGYCSYFASAMTVMCRIVGLPARYVEGYSVKGGEEFADVTGENAHAWTEVYFAGLGWVAFDPSNGGVGGEDGNSNESSGSNSQSGNASDSNDESDGAQETPAPEPMGGDTAQETRSPEPPSGEDASEQMNTPTPSPTWQPAPDDTPHDDHHSFAWIGVLLILLILLVVAVVAAIRLRTTDPMLLSRHTKNPEEACYILYRAILTLNRQVGTIPMSAESPVQYARRICADGQNSAFILFASAISGLAYGKAIPTQDTVEAGREAYTAFLNSASRRQRIRYTLTRLTRGLGRFDQIP